MVEELTGEELQESAEARRVSPWRHVAPLGRVLVLPRSTFARITTAEAAAWPAAIGLLVFAGVVKTALVFGFAVRGAEGTRYLAALGVRYGSDLLAPVAFALAVAGLLSPVQRAWQGDAPFGRLLSAMSLALVPLALRDIAQAVYIGVTRTVLLHPGLSALLAPPPRSVPGRLAYAALGQVDAFMLWSLVLLTLAVTVTHGRGWMRAVFTTLGIALLAVLLGSLPSLGFVALLYR